VECESKRNTGNNRGDWSHFKITQTISGQHTGKAGNQGTTKNSHIGHCTHTSGSANVKVQNITCRNMVCFRYVIVNTLHKGDNRDDDDDDNNNNNDNNTCYVVRKFFLSK
jgi:hypothetical protein